MESSVSPKKNVWDDFCTDRDEMEQQQAKETEKIEADLDDEFEFLKKQQDNDDKFGTA